MNLRSEGAPPVMDRRLRREIRQHAKTVSMAVRVHEVGHAMARLMTHQLMKYPIDEAIIGIELSKVEGIRDDVVMFNNTTWGPLLSRDMAAIFKLLHPGLDPGQAIQVAAEDFDSFRKLGCDLKGWLFARCIIELGGIAAEAKFTGKSLQDVLDQWEVGGDVVDMHRNARFLRRKFICWTLVERAAEFLEKAFDRPDVWAAVVAAAKSLVAPGTTPGATVLATVWQHLKTLPVPGFDALPLVRVRRDLRADKIATYALDDLQDWHWSDTSGGYQTKSSRQLLYAHVWCNDRLDGDLNHHCQHGDGPHKIKVCVLPSDNAANWRDIEIEAAWAMRRRSK